MTERTKELKALLLPFGEAIHGMVDGLMPLVYDALAVQAIQDHRLAVTWVTDKTVAVNDGKESSPSAVAVTLTEAVQAWLSKYDPEHPLAQAELPEKT